MHQQAAQGLASLGRGGDNTLVHMNHAEVAGLNALNQAINNRPLTVNPHTGMPEAMDLTEILLGLGMAAATIATAGAAIPALGPIAGTLATGAVGAGLGAGKNAIQGKDPGMGAAFGAASGLTAGTMSALGPAAETGGTAAATAATPAATSSVPDVIAGRVVDTATNEGAGMGINGLAMESAMKGSTTALPDAAPSAFSGTLTGGSAAPEIAGATANSVNTTGGIIPVADGAQATQGLGALSKDAGLLSGQATTGAAGTPGADMTFLSSPKDVGIMQSPVVDATKSVTPIEKAMTAEPSMLDNALKPFKDIAADPFSDRNKAAFAVGTGLFGLEDSMNQQAKMKHQNAAEAQRIVGMYKNAGVDTSGLPPSLLAMASQPTHFAAGGTIQEVQGINQIPPGFINQQPMQGFYPQSMIPQAQPLQRTTPIRHEVIGYADGGPIGYGYAEGGDIGGGDEGLLHGPGTGQSDGIMGLIGGEQGQEPVRLAEGEFVIPADVVSALGDGSTKAGAQALYDMLDRVRQMAYGHTQQTNPVNPDQVMPV